jgi:predicted metalloprotease
MNMYLRFSVAAAILIAASLLQAAPVANASPISHYADASSISRYAADVPKAAAAAPVYASVKHINTANGGLDSMLFTYLRPSLDKYWGQQLGKVYTAPGWSWINRAGGTATGCGDITLDDAGKEAAFYCPKDKVIYFNADFLLYQEANFGFAGIAETIAHEYGHHIQHLKGISSSMPVETSELQADRDAGAYLWWAGWNYTDPSGKKADWYNLADLQDVAYSTGDYDYSDPDHHGTPVERQDAITRGWNYGPGLNATTF